MTRQLPFITALLLLCSITLSASDATNYRSGSISGPDYVLSLPGLDMISAPVVACTELYNDGFETSFGNWIDGGSNCARSNSFPNSGSWSVELRGGPASEMSTPTNNFTGVGVTVSLSFYAQGFENGEGLLLEYATNSAGSFSVFTAWIAGNNLVNNTRYNVTVPMNSVTWTSNSKLRLRSLANATDDKVYVDDVVISNCCDIGTACNDNNQCTTGDVIQSNCQCAGTWQDADGDGTCDAFDICPGLDDYLVISEAPCDDGDPCTEGDHLDSDVCACQGTYVDWDQDGLCANDDPDDLDACNPDPQNPACNPCVTHDYAHFESNFGNWNSGGNDCDRVYAPQYAWAGNYCVRIQDNSGAASSTFSDNFSLAGLNNVSVAFSFITVSMENNEDFFLEVSTNGGSSYTTVKTWKSGTDFQNNSRQFAFVAVNGITWTNQSRFRIRCDASANDDRVYIDDIYVRSCLNYPALQAPEVNIPPTVSNERPVFVNPEDVILSPNPVTSELYLDGMPMEGTTIDVFNASGSIMRSERLSANTIDVSKLVPGLYFMRIGKDDQVIIKRFIKE